LVLTEIWYSPAQPVNDGQWHHWVFFVNSTNIGIWMDGQLVKNVPHNLTSGDFTASVPFYVLRDTSEPNRWLGDVDEFAVYRGVLSQAEIVDHYNNGAGKYYASSTDTPAIAQDSAGDFKPVSYQLPNTTNLGAAESPLQQTTTIASFTYDGDGRQVKAVVGSTTTYYIGSHYQIDNGVVTKYYLAGAQRVAMRKNGALYYLLSDHLGSTSITTDTNGNKLSELRYKAWGETRYSSGTTPTSYRYTGQREEAGFGLYFYNARWFDPLIGRFAQADTINPGGVQGLDRYACVNNSPINYVDPSGHDPWWCSMHSCIANWMYDQKVQASAKFGSKGNNNQTNSNAFGLIFVGEGGDGDKAAFHLAVAQEANRAYDAYCSYQPTGHCDYETPADLYRGTHGTTTITFSNSSGDEFCKRNANSGQQGVICWSNSSGKIDPILAAHEMGHVFNALIGNNDQTTPYTDLENERKQNRDFPALDVDITPGYSKNSGSNGEELANRYSMWVFDNFLDTTGGGERRKFMNDNMYTWILRQLNP
jgi:RHS repeat-associated protein